MVSRSTNECINKGSVTSMTGTAMTDSNSKAGMFSRLVFNRLGIHFYGRILQNECSPHAESVAQTPPPSTHFRTGDRRPTVAFSPTVQAACATRDASPVITSETDVCVVTLLPDVVDHRCALQCGCWCSYRSPERLPAACRAGDTSPGFGRSRWSRASALRLNSRQVLSRPCSALSCGLRSEHIECSDPCSETAGGRAKKTQFMLCMLRNDSLFGRNLLPSQMSFVACESLVIPEPTASSSRRQLEVLLPTTRY